MTTGAVSGLGTILQVRGGTYNDFNTIAEVVDISGPSISRNTLEATHMESTWKEYIAGAKDGGEVSFEVNFLPANATQKDLLTRLSSTAADVSFTMRIVWPDGSNVQTGTVDSLTHTITITGHGYTRTQPVYFSTTGTMPSPLVAGTRYYAAPIGVDIVEVYPTSQDAVARTNRIYPTPGTGTLSVTTGAAWTFTAIVTGFEPKAGTDEKLTASIKVKLTGTPTFPA